jgi:hypothetical protein
MSDREFGGECVCFSMCRLRVAVVVLILFILAMRTLLENVLVVAWGSPFEDPSHRYHINIISRNFTFTNASAGDGVDYHPS